MFLGNNELSGHIGDKDLYGVYLGDKEIWVNELTVYDATYDEGLTSKVENIKNTDYIIMASDHYVVTQQGTEPPYESKSSKMILELTEASKKYKYAKVTLQCRAYANYGSVDVYFNNSLVCKADDTVTTVAYVDLSNSLTGTGYIEATNKSSEPTWGASGRVAVSKVVLTNKVS